MTPRSNKLASQRTLGRLSLYRRLLKDCVRAGQEAIFSHELARLAGCTPAQVRRDVMAIGTLGNPARGYDIQELINAIGAFLDPGRPQGIALVGVGNLGRALLAYFGGRPSAFSIVAAFDRDPDKTNRVIHGCRCYPLERLEQVSSEMEIRQAIVAVPAQDAQDVVRRLCEAGIRGIVNFAPIRPWVPDGVFLENVDMTMTLERVAFFSRQGVTAKA